MKFPELKSLLVLLCLIVFVPVFSSYNSNTNQEEQNKVIDAWHHAAAVGDSATFFGLMTEDAVYLGEILKGGIGLRWHETWVSISAEERHGILNLLTDIIMT